MCTFREIWIPPIILPSDYVTVSIRSCPEVGDADYIIGLLDITEYRPVGRGGATGALTSLTGPRGPPFC